jgi:hypothetical protein
MTFTRFYTWCIAYFVHYGSSTLVNILVVEAVLLLAHWCLRSEFVHFADIAPDIVT